MAIEKSDTIIQIDRRMNIIYRHFFLVGGGGEKMPLSLNCGHKKFRHNNSNRSEDEHYLQAFFGGCPFLRNQTI